ncbi:LysR family transcriptional regulator [Limoniibacter endophyticus]|uniref:LysR family transcriptional regulator n=1 Tax=Limoniibacter endophyticus TaxID=1565040 RepID=A0A8J3DF49_9HYPH|nr:LysR family transcriptional regulator [Limoniibacter endophyticus]GHC65173.1 LysR family transcriptional regulator [Limoniibacter endophyticus]
MKLSRRLIPDITMLQAFECAARHGSFTRAAEELSLTQSAVSRQIRLLEEQLGQMLFERVRQRVVLSQAGRNLLPHVRRLLGQTEEMMLRAMATSHAPASLTIATLPTFASRWLIPRLPQFMEIHPGTLIDVSSRSAPFSFDEESFDIAIHYGQPVWANALCEFLCDEMLIPVASPSFLASRKIARAEHLLEHPLIHIATRPKAWALWFEQNAVESEALYRGHRFDQFSMMIEAVTAGIGVALLPRYLIEPELASGRLCAVFDSPLKTQNSYYVVVPDGKRQTPLTEDFVQWIKTEISAANRHPDETLPG